MPDDWRAGQDEDLDDCERLHFSDHDADIAREENFRVEETC